MFLAACAAPEAPVQDPLDYLRVGVNPEAEVDAIIADLERHGYVLGRKVVEDRYAAFGATRGPDSTVRVVTARGPSFAAQTPDVRAPRRVRLSLAPEPRPDFNGDGVPDIVIASREVERTCLVWLQVPDDGFVTPVFQPDPAWGDLPCVVDLDPVARRVLLEVTVPASASATARVIAPVRLDANGWNLDDGESAQAHWTREVERRRTLRDAAVASGEQALVGRLDAELAWIDHLHREPDSPNASTGVVPSSDGVLEAADDGQEAR